MIPHPAMVDSVVYSVSRQLRSRYRSYVETEDLQQELWIWVVMHTRKLEQWQEEHHPKSVERLLAKSLRNAGEKYCRKEKASQTGYEVDDEFFYSLGMVTDMLQLHFDPDWREPRAITLGTTPSGKPASEGWNLQAMVADVGMAYEKLSTADQRLLEFVYGQGDPHDNIAALALDWGGITWNAADHRVRRVLGRIRAQLGGPRPYEEEE